MRWIAVAVLLKTLFASVRAHGILSDWQKAEGRLKAEFKGEQGNVCYLQRKKLLIF
jgi:hypothetical protein